MKPIITLEHVSVRYDNGGSSATVALRDVSLQIFEGEYVVFLGPSGCGKSTLLYTIAGLETVTAGEVVVAGKDLRTTSNRERVDFHRNTIGMVFQAFYLIPHLSARDNLLITKMFSRTPSDERERKAHALMERFDISPYAGNKPSMMSGGQQQRTAIARALMNDPEIILADEPVGNLDSKNAEIVLQLLAQIHREEKKTVILVTHDPRDTHYADRVFYMRDGVIEHVVANTEMGRAALPFRGERSELEKLALANPGLSDMRLRARLITRRLLMPYDIDTEQKVETVIERYLRKDVTRAEMERFLDDSRSGAGLYAQKARHLASQIESLVTELERLSALEKSSTMSTPERTLEVKEIRTYLLRHFAGHVTEAMVNGLDDLIAARISGSLSSAALQEMLDKPAREGGLGLNRRTAKRFVEEIEFMLSLQP